MKIVFMGTPDFSVPALEELAKVHQVAAVVTQQDRPKGRGHKMQYTPVKEKALELNIPVYQPEKVKNPEFVDILREINPDVIVVIAFGQILSKEILDLPKYGCINVHASLLPKYRGAAPIQWAVIDGEEETGVTTMYMAEGLDTGDVIDTAVIKLDEKETGGSLFDKLAIEGGKLIVETLSKLENGTATRTPQDDEKSSYAGKITKELGQIDFTKPAVTIERLIRGLNPWRKCIHNTRWQSHESMGCNSRGRKRNRTTRRNRRNRKTLYKSSHRRELFKDKRNSTCRQKANANGCVLKRILY